MNSFYLIFFWTIFYISTIRCRFYIVADVDDCIIKQLASRADQSIEMVWACGKNGWLRYGYKGVDCRSKSRAGRPRLGWMGGMEVALGNRGMTEEAARQWAKDRNEWRALVQSPS